jgi:hypothetical protein
MIGVEKIPLPKEGEVPVPCANCPAKAEMRLYVDYNKDDLTRPCIALCIVCWMDMIDILERIRGGRTLGVFTYRDHEHKRHIELVEE